LRKTEAASQKIGLQEAGISSSKSLRQGVLPTWLRTLPVVLLVAYLLVLLSRFAHSGNQFLSFFEDDFFYYLVVAKNLIHHGVSTFNGTTRSGY